MHVRRVVLAAVTAAALAVPLGMTAAVADDVSSAPTRVFATGAAGVSTPWGLATGPDGSVYVSSWSQNAVRVFAAGATGAAAAVRTITGAATGLNIPDGIAVDKGGYLYVANAGAKSVTVYAPGADGDVAPVRTIKGALTGFQYPDAVQVGADGSIYVVDLFAASVSRFSPTADGNVAPRAKLAGPSSLITSPWSMALGADGSVYVGNAHSVLVFSSLVDGDHAPVREIGGLASDLAGVGGIALDSSGNVYATSSTSYTVGGTNNQVVVFGPTADGNATPIRRLTGAPTQLGRPAGIVLGADRSVIVAQEVGPAVNVYAPLVKFAKPSVVRSLAVSGKTTAAKRTVTWAAPASTGGKPVTGYTVTVKHGSKKLLTKHVGASTKKVTLARALLSPGTNTVTVAAVNAVGTGPAASKSFEATFSKPGKARSVAVSGAASAAKRTVSWKAPTSNGGKPVTSYKVVVKQGSKVLLSKTVSGSVHKLVVKRSTLRDGTNKVSVVAHTAIGNGPSATKSFTVHK